MAPEAAKARRTVRRKKLEEAMPSNLDRSFLSSMELPVVYMYLYLADALSMEALHAYI